MSFIDTVIRALVVAAAVTVISFSRLYAAEPRPPEKSIFDFGKDPKAAAPEKADDPAAQLAALQKTLTDHLTPAAARALADSANKLADECILRGKPELAVSAATLTDAAAKLAKDEKFASFTADRLSNIRLLQAEAAKTAPAVAKLEKAPNDPDANLAVGRFLCLWRGDWRQGLPLLVKGSDTALKELAAQELSASSDAPMQLAMGNAWWDFASKLEGPPHAYAQDHAADAYLQAIPELTGIHKTLAQKRVAEAPARLPFPRIGETQTAAVRGAPAVATSIHIVADDFVTGIYHNGKPVPNSDRKLLAEIYGAQVERVTLELKPGDWVVFNVANNHLRWHGAYYFAAAFLSDQDKLVYPSEFRSGNWSSCDDVKEVAAFISDRDHLRDHKPQPVEKPWDRGDHEISKIEGWNGQAMWGEPTSASTWIKFIVPEK
jgi:hypothetical protein